VVKLLFDTVAQGVAPRFRFLLLLRLALDQGLDQLLGEEGVPPLPAVVHQDLVAGEPPGPGQERLPDVILVKFPPQRRGRFLQHVLRIIQTADERQDVTQQGVLVLEQKPNKQ
jgi:hypothetical protein